MQMYNFIDPSHQYIVHHIIYIYSILQEYVILHMKNLHTEHASSLFQPSGITLIRNRLAWGKIIIQCHVTLTIFVALPIQHIVHRLKLWEIFPRTKLLILYTELKVTIKRHGQTGTMINIQISDTSYHENLIQSYLDYACVGAAISTLIKCQINTLCQKSDGIVGTCGARMKEIRLQILFNERRKVVDYFTSQKVMKIIQS